MPLEIRVFCTLQFEGFHAWEAAPESVAYLRSRHRHIFHVRAEKIVSHDDRDVEFITMKTAISEEVNSLKTLPRARKWSCERWAKEILERYGLDRVEVSEDGENGAIVERIR